MDKSTFSILFIMQKGKPNAQGNAPIFARITVNHQMTHLATRYYLPADRWLPKEGRTIGRTKEEKEINAYLVHKMPYRTSSAMKCSVQTNWTQLDSVSLIGEMQQLKIIS